MKFVLRFLYSRRLTVAEREMFNAASRLARARAEHKRVIGHYEALDEAWRNLNRIRREARQLGLFETVRPAA